MCSLWAAMNRAAAATSSWCRRYARTFALSIFRWYFAWLAHKRWGLPGVRPHGTSSPKNRPPNTQVETFRTVRHPPVHPADLQLLVHDVGGLLTNKNKKKDTISQTETQRRVAPAPTGP